MVAPYGSLGKSRKLLLALAKSGGMDAQYELGEDYLRSEPTDRIEAKKWLKNAAEAGHVEAALALANLVESLSEQVNWLRKAAEAGHRTAQLNLGILLRTGEEAVLNVAEAMQWFFRAADAGDRDAQYYYAEGLRTGAGVQQDSEGALSWMLRSAENGLALAQGALAAWHLETVPRRTAEAMRWLTRAANQGSTMEQYRLGRLHLELAEHAEAYFWLTLVSPARFFKSFMGETHRASAAKHLTDQERIAVDERCAAWRPKLEPAPQAGPLPPPK